MGVGVGLGVGLSDGLGVGEVVGVSVGVGVGVGVDVGVGVEVGDEVGVGVVVEVGDGVGLGAVLNNFITPAGETLIVFEADEPSKPTVILPLTSGPPSGEKRRQLFPLVGLFIIGDPGGNETVIFFDSLTFSKVTIVGGASYFTKSISFGVVAVIKQTPCLICVVTASS